MVSTKPAAAHLWLVRRWNAFSIAITSVTALGLSLVVGYALGITWLREWQPIVGVLCLVFLVSAIFSWRDVMGMLEFQARRRF